MGKDVLFVPDEVVEQVAQFPGIIPRFGRNCVLKMEECIVVSILYLLKSVLKINERKIEKMEGILALSCKSNQVKI